MDSRTRRFDLRYTLSAKRILLSAFASVTWFIIGCLAKLISQSAFPLVRCAYIRAVLTSLGGEMMEGIDWP
jgi:hypothetical protein